MLDDMTTFIGNLMGSIFGSRSNKILKKLAPRVTRINALEAKYAKMSDTELRGMTAAFRKEIADLRKNDPKADENQKVERYLDHILHDAFAVVREAGKRTMGMRHFDVQLIGGMVLHSGMISEMVTGEGKTLVATLPCYLNALARRPEEYAYVHVVTVNDYLAKRDCDWNRPLFQMLGMTCGSIQSGMDSGERHPIYSCDIVYGTNSEFGFDYLRDNMKPEAERQVQKKRHFAIVDEVDSILIDEARTPLIISGGRGEEVTEKYAMSAQIVEKLTRVTEEEQVRVETLRLQQIFEEPAQGHYMVDEKDHGVTLTARGIKEVETQLGIDNYYSGAHMAWPHFIDNALKAKEIYKKGTNYEVAPGREGKLEVVITDEFTGRLMYGRRWSDGLHQAVEAKEILAGEKIKIEGENQTLATITIQNFFKLYNKLGGMTGTAITEAREFGKIYKLEVAQIPTNRPMRRLNFADVIYGSEKEKFEGICEEIGKYHATGRPILVGTTSVEKSERLEAMLNRRGYKGMFNVLNAKQHEREAHIVDRAGYLGSITVATNMAGRGTDIKLQPFKLEQLLEIWQEAKHDGKPLAPKDFDTKRSKAEMEEHLNGYWAKIYLDEKTFKDTPNDQRRAVLEKFWLEKNIPPLSISEHIRDLGGLHIIGTERHEARRIDNQLRGRSGRQGDPGSSRFFLSLDDDLMRIFAKDWVRNFLRNSGMKDGAAIESKMVSNSIEKAQRRVEEHNFGIRRRLLEYDEVMNEQRKLIYDLRQRILEWRDTRETLMGWIEDVISLEVERLGGVEDPPPAEVAAELVIFVKKHFDTTIAITELEGRFRDELETRLIEAVKAEYASREKAFGEVTIPLTKVVAYSADDLMLTGEARVNMVRQKIADYANVPLERVQPTENPCFSEAWVPLEPAAPVLFNPQEVLEGKAPSLVHSPQQMQAMRKLEHDLLLNIIDDKWKNHLQDMDALREGIHLRGYAQKDPKLEYKREGFDKFMETFSNMKVQATQVMFQIQVKKDIEQMEVAKVWNEDEAKTVHAEAGSVFDSMPVPEAAPAGVQTEGGQEMQAASEHGGSDVRAVSTIRGEKVTQPNDPCPCGSGKKFKKCHGRSMGGDQEIAGKARVGG